MDFWDTINNPLYTDTIKECPITYWAKGCERPTKATEIFYRKWISIGKVHIPMDKLTLKVEYQLRRNFSLHMCYSIHMTKIKWFKLFHLCHVLWVWLKIYIIILIKVIIINIIFYDFNINFQTNNTCIFCLGVKIWDLSSFWDRWQ